MAHVLEAVLKERGALCPCPASRPTAGDLEEAPQVALQALAADGATRRVRSASGQATAGMAYGAHQGDDAAGVAGERRSGSAGHEAPAGAFTRTCLTVMRSSFTYSLDTGSSSVWSGAGADLGDTVHWAAPAQSAGAPAVGPLAVSNACVYNVLAKIVRTQGERAVAATAAGAQPPPWAVRAADASAGDLITEFHARASAMFASFGAAPARMTRTEQWVRELLHDAMRPGHSTSVCLVQGSPDPASRARRRASHRSTTRPGRGGTHRARRTP